MIKSSYETKFHFLIHFGGLVSSELKHDTSSHMIICVGVYWPPFALQGNIAAGRGDGF